MLRGLAVDTSEPGTSPYGRLLTVVDLQDRLWFCRQTAGDHLKLKSINTPIPGGSVTKIIRVEMFHCQR